MQGQLWPTEQLSITLSGRVDHWRNYNGRNLETNVPAGTPTATSRTLPDREDTVFSPRAAVLYRVSDKVSAWGSLGSGFRAPTLNELYRQFRVGAVLTLANDELGPERLVGGELGLNVAPAENFSVRTTWFDNRMKNPVSNVTIATNTQQRQNLGRTRIWGIQMDAEYRFGQYWRASAGYLYNQAKVKEFAANPDAGRQVPAAGAEEPRLGQRRLLEPARRHAVVQRARLRPPVQRGPEQRRRARRDASRACRPTRRWSSRRCGRLAATSTCSSACRTCSTRSTSCSSLPTTIGSPRLVNGGIRVRWSGR